MIPESEISECPEHEPKSKIGNIFVNEKTLEEYSVKIYEIDPYFYEHQRKIQVNESWCKYIFFRSDFYFSGYLLAVEIDGKGHTDRDTLFEKKRKEKEHKKKNLVVNLLELIQTLVEYKHLLVSLKTDN